MSTDNDKRGSEIMTQSHTMHTPRARITLKPPSAQHGARLEKRSEEPVEDVEESTEAIEHARTMSRAPAAPQARQAIRPPSGSTMTSPASENEEDDDEVILMIDEEDDPAPARNMRAQIESEERARIPPAAPG